MRGVLSIACVTVMALALPVTADTFGTGANQFSISFVTISGATNPTNGWCIVNNDYRIGVFEITNDQWNKFNASLGVPVTGTPPFAYAHEPYWTGANVPTNCVSWYEAAQFVNWLNTINGYQPAYKFNGAQGTGNYALATWSAAEADNGTNLYRHKDAFYYLPNEQEWIKAAFWNGTMIQTYSNASPGDLVSGSPDPAKWNYALYAESEPWNVGSGVQELNGTFDMMGNVCEWIENPAIDATYGTSSDRGLFGGSYLHPVNALHCWDGNAPENDHDYIGFRVASEVPEPCSLALLALGGLAMLRRKR